MARLSPPSAEPYFDRWAWITLAVVGVFLALGAISTMYILQMPTDGWHFDYNDPSPPPLRHFAGDWETPLLLGDQILGVDGFPVHGGEGEVPIAFPGWQVGNTVTYSILRDGQQMDVAVLLHRMGWVDVLRSVRFTIALTPTEWLWSLIAVVVFFLRPRIPAAQLMLLAFVPNNATTKLFWAAVNIAHNFAPAPIFYIYQLITYFWGYLFFPAIIMIALRFPQPVFPLTRWPRAVPALMFGIPAAVSVLSILFRQQDVFIPATLVLQAAMLLFALVSAYLQVRKHTPDPTTRAQGLWVVFGFGLCIPPLLIAYLLELFGFLVLSELGWIYELVFVLALPICLAIAITRYHLFDIDVILRRTLQYTILTLLLALVYFAGVVLLQSIFNSFSTIEGSDQMGDTAVIFSTLAIAALFTPLRRRVQGFIDRRFFRSKYDAEWILSNFAANTRQEVGLEPLSAALLNAVEETMQPERISLWIKPSERLD